MNAWKTSFKTLPTNFNKFLKMYHKHTNLPRMHKLVWRVNSKVIKTNLLKGAMERTNSQMQSKTEASDDPRPLLHCSGSIIICRGKAVALWCLSPHIAHKVIPKPYPKSATQKLLAEWILPTLVCQHNYSFHALSSYIHQTQECFVCYLQENLWSSVNRVYS